MTERKKYLKHIEQKVDEETGMPITTTKSFAINIKQENFYISYIENMAGVFKLRSAVDIKVLIKFCMIASFDSGLVCLTCGKRKEVMDYIGISTQQLTNSISSLKKKGLLKGEQGDYWLNPMVFWKGRTDVRNDLIKNNGVQIMLDFKVVEEFDTETNMSITLISNNEFEQRDIVEYAERV